MPEIELEEEEYITQITKPVLKRILSLLAQYKLWAVGFIVAISITSILDGTFTYVNKMIIDEGIMPGDVHRLYQLITFYGALLLVQAVTVFGFVYLAGVLGERIRYDLRKEMFGHLQTLSLSYYSGISVGRLMARVTSDTERVAELVTWGLLDTAWAIINIIVSVAFMLSINWKLAAMVFVIIPILIVVSIEFRKRILVEFRRARRTNSRITGAYNENITGVRVVKALGREEKNLEEFRSLTNEMYDASYRAAWLSALFLPVVQIISAAALGIIAWYGGIQSLHGLLTIGGIHAFVSYLTFMIWPVQDIARVYAEMQHAIASAERIFTLLDTPPDIKNRPDAVPAETLLGDIEFDHVDFWYEKRNPILRDFTLKVRAGETIALVGPTGGGKTTIMNLLCRFYEPKRGVIRINGRDYTQYTLESIHSRLGIVLQTPHLFSGTIRENIRYGRLDATDEEIEEAAKMAGAHEFILTLENGYDEKVGEGGNLLSTGQKQLISLARAILADPELFIMDEATSSVDTLTEALIQRGMANLLKGRTAFVVAHRLSTIRQADRILVIEKGKITEMGSHAELLRLRGHYYQLYTRQFKEEKAVSMGLKGLSLA
jgi:ATP-binding cassette subfamily B protein